MDMSMELGTKQRELGYNRPRPLKNKEQHHAFVGDAQA